MRESNLDCLQWIPVLCEEIHLYHDDRFGRWVMSGTNQVVFLNPASYEVVKLCDGNNSFGNICEQLCDNGVFQAATVRQSVLNIIQDLETNGFILNRGSDSLQS